MKNYPYQINRFLVVFASVIQFTNYFPVVGQDINSAGEEFQYSKDTYTYKTVDRHEIRADVYRYPGEEIRPAIIQIHGGALIFGTRNWLDSEEVELYLKAGYTVVSIDYRLAPETKLKAIIEDLEDAYAWVRAKGPDLFRIDPDRIAVVGKSAGGYLTLMAGFRLRPRPRALVSFYGYGDITGSWYSEPDPYYNQAPPVSKDQAFNAVGDSVISSTTENSLERRIRFYLYCRQQGLWPKEVSGHDQEKEREWFSDYEPLRNVTSSYPPTMLLHGESDTDVPFEQSVLMSEAFKLHGVNFEFITNPNWGHAFDNAGMEDSSVHEAFARVVTFLNKYVKD
jgi:acetyl esterase/lipase